MPTLDHPYTDLTAGQWLRGNLHTHTTRSDGDRPPQTVIDDYAARGYGFLMLSDHDIHTSDADYTRLDARGMVLIPGNEVTRHGPHLLHVDADRWVAPLASRQEVINSVLAAQRETGRGFVIVNHPNWQGQFDHCTIHQMREWAGYLGMEIYNGVIRRLDGSPYATNKWDMLLSEGRRVWGFVNDDSHSAADVELGWNVAYIKQRSPAGVIEALRAGRFYGSTGVVIKSIRVQGSAIRIETENAQRIAAIQNTGMRFAVVDAATIEVEVPARAKYVRFDCWGAGERMAWTQPFVVNEDANAEGTPGPKYIAAWQVTPLAAGVRLEQASPAQAAGMSWSPLASDRSREHGLYGFADLRPQIQSRAGVVYLAAEVESDADRRGTLYFGYDGPIRVWLNDQLVFDGPGSNPAIPDKLALHGAFRRGANRLLVALDSNGGKAWGVFGRVEWGRTTLSVPRA